MSGIENRNSVTGLDALEIVAAVFKGEPLFLRGFSAGVESETWEGRPPKERRTDSPITLLAEMPAWEGSNALRMHEQDFRYSVGAIVGAFATRAGFDTEELYDRLAHEESEDLHGMRQFGDFQQASLETRQLVADTLAAERLGLAGPLTKFRRD